MPGLEFDREHAKEPVTGHFPQHLQNLLYLPCVIQPVMDQRGDNLAITIRPPGLPQVAPVAIHFSIPSLISKGSGRIASFSPGAHRTCSGPCPTISSRLFPSILASSSGCSCAILFLDIFPVNITVSRGKTSGLKMTWYMCQMM